MDTARALHQQNSHLAIEDISPLLIGVDRSISLHGSVIKYCYGISLELYFKWILVEAKTPDKKGHELPRLIRKLPPPVLDKLKSIYSDYLIRYTPKFRVMEASVHGVTELSLDWSTFENFIGNLDKQKFIVGRYADPSDYSIFQSLSAHRSREMNSYMASDDFFVLGDKVLAYEPNPRDYE